MAYQNLEIVKEGPLGIVRMRRNNENTLDQKMLLELAQAFEELQAERGIRVGILESAGERFYSNGLDLEILAKADTPTRAGTIGQLYDTIIRLYALEMPMVAAVSGIAMAGGAILSLVADFRVAAARARWSLTEIRFGMPLPYVVQIALKAAVAPPAATYLAFTGAIVKPSEAESMGLYHEIYSDAEFAVRSRRYAMRMAELPNDMLRLTKRNWRELSLADMRRAEEIDKKSWGDILNSPHFMEGISSVVEKRRPVFNKG